MFLPFFGIIFFDGVAIRFVDATNVVSTYAVLAAAGNRVLCFMGLDF